MTSCDALPPVDLSAFQSVQHAFHATMNKPNLWTCAAALVQGDSKAIEQQIGLKNGGSLADSPFAQALSKASMHVVVRNSTCDVCSRIWQVEMETEVRLALFTART